MVAGGGGGMSTYGNYYDEYGYAGGLNGSKGAAIGNYLDAYNSITDAQRAGGGTQIAPGKGTNNLDSYKGSFGTGGNYGGGGGYYGGGGGFIIAGSRVSGGGGGSSFISGFIGCVAIDPTDTTNDPRTQDAGTGFSKTALNFNTAIFGASPTWRKDGKEVAFHHTVMIDGAGYEWKDGVKSGTAGTMPNPDGGTMTGNTGDGYARITKWEKLE
jgi:hypothetical protein